MIQRIVLLQWHKNPFEEGDLHSDILKVIQFSNNCLSENIILNVHKVKSDILHIIWSSFFLSFTVLSHLAPPPPPPHQHTVHQEPYYGSCLHLIAIKRKFPLIRPPPPTVIGPSAGNQKNTSGFKPPLACIAMKSIFYDLLKLKRACKFKKYINRHCYVACFEMFLIFARF